MAVFLIGGGGGKPAAAVVNVIADARAIDGAFRGAVAELRTVEQAGGMIRLDAGEHSLPETNEWLRAQIHAAWIDVLRSEAARSEDVAWVEIYDTSARGIRQHLLLALDAAGVSIDAARTTRGPAMG